MGSLTYWREKERRGGHPRLVHFFSSALLLRAAWRAEDEWRREKRDAAHSLATIWPGSAKSGPRSHASCGIEIREAATDEWRGR